MDRSILAILAYTIARYEKGRIPMRTTFLYRKWHITLRRSLDYLETLTKMLDGQSPVTQRAINDIVDYVECSGMIRFDPLQRSQFCTDVARDCSVKQCKIDEIGQIIAMMHCIVTTCCEIISKRGYGYKRELFYLLHAFHTLARGCIKSSDTDIIGVNIYALSPKEALDDAKKTLNVVGTMSLSIMDI